MNGVQTPKSLGKQAFPCSLLLSFASSALFPLLTLLLLLPAVVSEVGNIIIFHVPFHCFEAGACVLLGEGVCHVVDDFQVVSDSPVDMTHRPGQEQTRHKVGPGPQAQGSARDGGQARSCHMVANLESLPL